jgi:hypothetical protein
MSRMEAAVVVSLDIAKHIPYRHEIDMKPCAGPAFVRDAQYRYLGAVAGRDLDAGGGHLCGGHDICFGAVCRWVL